MFRAILNANEHGETVSIGFPISKSAYADTISKLQQCGMGDAVRQDCRVEEVASSAFPVLQQLEGELVNVDELDYLAKRLDSFDIGEAAQFQAMAAKLELHKIADFINLTFCCQQATVIADFCLLQPQFFSSACNSLSDFRIIQIHTIRSFCGYFIRNSLLEEQSKSR